MAEHRPVPPSGGDGLSGPGGSSRRKGGSAFSWSAPMPSPAEIDGLERRFPDVIQLPSAAIDREVADWSVSGLIVRPLSRWIPPEAVIREFRRAGLAGGIHSISLAHRTLLLKFERPEACSAALRQPWIVNGQPLAAEPWRPDFVPVDDALCFALLWIRLPNLPIEYWNEETLRCMLSVAGEFVDADVFTKERRRGSFARVCVRVDLTKPLRPGARFRSQGSPFWQQFSYEHVDCICSSCGSLHSAELCPSSPEQGSSADGPLYGPWMAALRLRKPPSIPLNDGASVGLAPGEGLKVKGSSASLGADDGWRKPGRVSRRRMVPSSSTSNIAIVHSEVVEEMTPCRDSQPVPITVHSEATFLSVSATDSGLSAIDSILPSNQKISKGRRRNNSPGRQNDLKKHSNSPFQFKAKGVADQAELPTESHGSDHACYQGTQQGGGIVAVNPFTLSGSPKSRVDANPASLKRARAADFIGPRVSPKPVKGKGKGPSVGSGLPAVSGCPLASGSTQNIDAHEMAIVALKNALDVSSPGSRGGGSIPMDQSDGASRESSKQLVIHDQLVCKLPDQSTEVLCTDSGFKSDMILTGPEGGA